MSTSLEPIIAIDRWTIHELSLSLPKIDAIWKQLSKYKTLFSDITRGDPSTFAKAVLSPSMMWFEVRNDLGDLVGLVYFDELHKVTDCRAHMMFFDRKPAEKCELMRELMKWMFDRFPLQRMTVEPPVIYHAVVRLLRRLKFTEEGVKRQSMLIGGKWNDQFIFGITRGEVLVQ